ncbi:MAG: histidine phosphatase family protein [Candidimonas sp.]
MPNKIILIRHGESTGNIDRNMYEQPDSAVCLTEKGVKQCLIAAEWLASKEHFLRWHRFGVRVYTSEYTRAIQSARIILDKIRMKDNVPTITPWINEINVGEVTDGTSLLWKDETGDFHFPQGESFKILRHRASCFIKQIEGLLSERDIMLVCHNGVIRTLTAELLGMTDSAMLTIRSANSSIAIFERDNDCYRQIEYFKPIIE